MNIVSAPPLYAPAYRDALFGLSAATDELVELDIFTENGDRLIGRRRFRGSNAYRVNVARYAQSLMNVTPLRHAQCAFAVAEGRTATLIAEAGALRVSARLCAGIRALHSSGRLSSAPAELSLAPGENDEIALLPPGGTLQAKITLQGNTVRTLELDPFGPTDAPVVFYLSTNDIANRVGSGGLDGYRTMELRIETADGPLLSQRYRIERPQAETVRLCWWNVYGQVDYYTMQSAPERGYEILKDRILAADGYRVTGSSRESRIRLVSAYENRETMTWLSEMLCSPRVWTDDGNRFAPVDIRCGSVVTSGERLSRLDIEVREAERENFQNL